MTSMETVDAQSLLFGLQHFCGYEGIVFHSIISLGAENGTSFEGAIRVGVNESSFESEKQRQGMSCKVT